MYGTCIYRVKRISDVVECQSGGGFLARCSSFERVVCRCRVDCWPSQRGIQSRVLLHVTAVLYHCEPTGIYSTKTPISQAEENVELSSKNKTSCV